MSAIAPALIAAGATTVNAVSKGGPKRQYKYNKKLATYQNQLNRENQQWILEQQKKLTAEQLEYDSPAAQMARYQKAGLNPNLIYGQGTPGNMGQPVDAGNLPGVNVGTVDAGSLGNLGSEFIQGMDVLARTDLSRARAQESGVKQDLMQLQQLVLKNNPLLDEDTLNSVRLQMQAVAEIKQQERNWLLAPSGQDMDSTNGFNKMSASLQKLWSDNNLTAVYKDNALIDTEIKDSILKSKKFQNDLDEVMRNWMVDADITPQHIYQGIMIFLQNLMRMKK